MPRQAAGGRASGAQVQPRRGCGGWSRLFPPCVPLPPAAGGPGCAWEEGWVEGGAQTQPRAALQPGLSELGFLRPPPAALATVASGRLTMLAGAGARLPGRVTSLNCSHDRLSPAHLASQPACWEDHGVPGWNLTPPSWVAASTQAPVGQEAGTWLGLALESGHCTRLVPTKKPDWA